MQQPLATLVLLAASLFLGGCGGAGGGTATASGSTTTTTAATTSVTASLATVFLAAAGANHTVALAPKGAASGPAWVWGDNTWGQVGDGTLDTPKAAPVALKSSALPVTTAWKAIAAGAAHTLAIRSDGSLWAWGRNDNGQLGDGTTGAGRSTPVQIGSLKDWLAIAAGDAHSLALEGSGTAIQIMSWGQNAAGQLGLGKTLAVNNLTDFTDFAVPTKATKAITVVNAANVLNAIPFAGQPWKAVAAGGSYSLVMRADGVVFSWGDNSAGQLGQTFAVNATVPTQLSVFGSSPLQANSIAAGRQHALAILTDRTLYSWGANGSGQLGNGNTTGQVAPAQVPVNANMAASNDWFAVAAGGAHTLGIKLSDQSLWSWGSNSDGQLGNGTTTDVTTGPAPIAVGKRWLAVAAGRSHSMAIDTDGKLWVWGRNVEGQLGLGTASTTPTLVPTTLP